MAAQPIVLRGDIKLKDFDADFHGGRDKKKTKPQTKEAAHRIAALQELLNANARNAVLLLFQGLDASGKDGAVRRVLHYVNPAGVETANFKQPSADEMAH